MKIFSASITPWRCINNLMAAQRGSQRNMSHHQQAACGERRQNGIGGKIWRQISSGEKRRRSHHNQMAHGLRQLGGGSGIVSVVSALSVAVMWRRYGGGRKHGAYRIRRWQRSANGSVA